MTMFENAPLIEAFFELRWGFPEDENEEGQYTLSDNDQNLFPMQFASEAKANGFSHVESVNQKAPFLPHIIKYRFREEEKSWPCFQVGNGILTVNQVNEGYDWKPFKDYIIRGLEILRASYPGALEEMPNPKLVLRYQDGFIVNNGSVLDYINSNLGLSLSFPEPFLQSENKVGEMAGVSTSFKVPIMKPEGELLFNLDEAYINGNLGLVMNTRVVSDKKKNEVEFDNNFLDEWLEQSHSELIDCFKKLVRETVRGE